MLRNFLLTGPAGAGKTSLAEKIGQDINAKTFFYSCHKWTTVEELVSSVDIGKVALKNPAPYKMGPVAKALASSNESKVVLIIDELDKANPAIDNLFLDVLQNYRVETEAGWVYGKAENIQIFFTSNGERELSNPLLRRLLKFKINYIPVEEELAILTGESSEYYMGGPRALIAKISEAGVLEQNKNPAIIKPLLKVVDRLRAAEFDISLSEIQQFLHIVGLAENKEEVKLALSATIFRTEDYTNWVDENFGLSHLVGLIWSQL